jgi:hypothetical protein
MHIRLAVCVVDHRMLIVSRRLLRRVEALLVSSDFESRYRFDVLRDPGSGEGGIEDDAESSELELTGATAGLSGFDWDVVHMVTQVADVTTLSKLSQVSRCVRDLVRDRTRGLMRFLSEMSMTAPKRDIIIGGRIRTHAPFRCCLFYPPSIFSGLPKVAGYNSPGMYPNAWTTMIGRWQLWVYLDKEDYFCVTAMRLMDSLELSQEECACFCVMRFKWGAIDSPCSLNQVLFSYDFNTGGVSDDVFAIYPRRVDYFLDGIGKVLQLIAVTWMGCLTR